MFDRLNRRDVIAGASALGALPWAPAAQAQAAKQVPFTIVINNSPWFDGFRERIRVKGIEALVRPVADPGTWMLREGWQKHGRLSVHEVPSTA